MVLTNPSRFLDIYNLLKDDALAQGCETVLILVARDCDSIAACRILSEILKSDNISFNVKPVASYNDLEKVNESLLAGNEELRTIVMINCGGNIDIGEVFTNLIDGQLVYIIDSHRPYHPNNVDDQTFAIIVDDGNFVDQVATEVQDISMNKDDEDEEEEESEQDEEEEEDEEDEEKNGFVDDEAEEDDDEEEEEEEEEEESDEDDDAMVMDEDAEEEMKKKKEAKEKRLEEKKKRLEKREEKERKKKKKKQDAKKKLKKQKKNPTLSMSNQSSYGKSVSSLMYDLSCVLMKDNLDGLLWYAIVGMTDQLVHERVSTKVYQQEYDHLRSLVLNTYPADDLASQNVLKVSAASARLDQQQKERIVPCEDYRFMLYRHWNLYESLYNSKYVACTLQTWKAKGRHFLETLFALIGIPLDQAKQKYLSMNSQFKNTLKQQLAFHAPRFGLNEIYYNSFLKKYECSIDISASDTVYAVTALMESDNLETDASDEEIWEQNFWDAYDSLSNKNVELLEITRQVTVMIEKKNVILQGPYRYAILNDSVELKYFTHPMALTKLGLFMMDALVSMGKQKKPFLIAALNESNNNYLIVGISGSHSSDIQKNSFGFYFKEAVKLTNCTFKYQSFDTSVVEIAKIDMPNFIEKLNEGLALEDDGNEQ
ncbi:cell division cycle protein 45 [Cavenderia fasciculata]|uniref:Cell division cycle protein 45 n=1 Tax=Cavenderia fasciculata TaxID=261658 RepID=F4Q748_CACFS|nr:cell division cycle protein 45 [Cavenderia fasciculata]EGG16230.1 cell division cycle protein 45 [Cavenderia fasciculata]|eukprot:XP_004354614.1 cell division cycle protein 45 [Cavenderia fasciculata]